MLSLLFLSFHEEKSFVWYLCFNNTITLTGSNFNTKRSWYDQSANFPFFFILLLCSLGFNLI